MKIHFKKEHMFAAGLGYLLSIVLGIIVGIISVLGIYFITGNIDPNNLGFIVLVNYIVVILSIYYIASRRYKFTLDDLAGIVGSFLLIELIITGIIIILTPTAMTQSPMPVHESLIYSIVSLALGLFILFTLEDKR